MISSRDVYKIVGDAKLHRQTGLCSSFMQSIPTDLLEHSSDATGAAEVVAGVSGIRASINHGRTMDETWTIHGQLASILAAQRLRHALSRKRCAARSIGVHERPWHINVPKSHFYELIF